MQEPDLDRMWETFIRIESPLDLPSSIRTMVYPTILCLRKDINPKDVLPDYCVMTRKVEPKAVADISISQTEVMDKSKIKDEKIEKAWRIIGEQGEWLLNLLDIYKEDARITPKQVLPFLHYFANMTQLEVRF